MWPWCPGSGARPRESEKLENDPTDHRYRCTVCGRVLVVAVWLPKHIRRFWAHVAN